MTRILGFAPGSRITGYGVIEMDNNRAIYVDCGCIRAVGESLAERLKSIYDGIQAVVETHTPDEVSIEKVFVGKNVDSALKLGQARGAALCAAQTPDALIVEYSPTEIKKAIVGKGRADKTQVQHMVRILLNLQGKLQVDAADALAIALCHGHTRKMLNKLDLGTGNNRNAWTNYIVNPTRR